MTSKEYCHLILKMNYHRHCIRKQVPIATINAVIHILNQKMKIQALDLYSFAFADNLEIIHKYKNRKIDNECSLDLFLI